MLKNIRLHLETDEDKQLLLEEKLALHLVDTLNENINSFQRNIPSVVPYISNVNETNLAIFCNKFGEYNIVDYGLGRTFYGLHPSDEIQSQVDNYVKNSSYVHFDSHDAGTTPTSELATDTCRQALDVKSLCAYKKMEGMGHLPDHIPCLVVFGCGLGLHIQQLLENYKIKNLIVYEPEAQYFKCSNMALSWKNILETARSSGTSLFLQLEKDGRNLIDDIEELRTVESLDGFYYFQHYNHPMFNTVTEQLDSQSWHSLKKQSLSGRISEGYKEYTGIWSPKLSLDSYNSVEIESALFQQNMKAFSRYYPDIHEKFVDYQPQNWLPVRNQSNQINIIKKSSLVPWYGENPADECAINFSSFTEQPNKDGVVLGYDGKKLQHYLHYKFVKKTQKLLEEIEENIGSLPDNIQSLIMFGLGSGYQLEILLKEHNVEKLFLCEPNPDFFYASLFAIDWNRILSDIESSDTRLYLNIGDDGKNLFRDLLSQFYSIGPYILNNTYFYQGYYNSALNESIAQLREQLRVVITMGEYFDHAYYGIAHTKEALDRGYATLKKSPAKFLQYEDKQVPVFLVGNGPSLDQSISMLKEWQHNAIIVTCGTSLQVMQRHGIKSDFHAEIEQNRTTYDWANLIDDPEYLKSVSLISCNGIHPDTCSLYKDVYVVFKEGESSTVSTLEIMGSKNFETLQFAFPTVANFACNLFSALGCADIYLIGIDLGFIDNKHHHSKDSRYYQEDGSEVYNYAEKQNTSLVVPGNFRKAVNTKHEFKLANQIIEESIRKSRNTSSFYNCSDGARISGASPLSLANVLITSSKEQKASAILRIKTEAFENIQGQGFSEKYESKYSKDTLKRELGIFDQIINTPITSVKEAEALINKQKELLFFSYRKAESLLFYYLYGTVNYANAMLSKLLSASNDPECVLKIFNEGLRCWQDSYAQFVKLINSESKNFDTSAYQVFSREALLLNKHTQDKSILVVTKSIAFKDSIILLINEYFKWNVSVTIVGEEQLEAMLTKPFNYVIYQYGDTSPETKNLEKYPIKGTENTIATVYNADLAEILAHNTNNPDITIVAITNDANNKLNQYWFSNHFSMASLLLSICTLKQNCSVILPKYVKSSQYKEPIVNESKIPPDVLTTVYDFALYMAVYLDRDFEDPGILPNGTRGKLISERLSPDNHIFIEYEPDIFKQEMQRIVNWVPSIVNDSKFVGTMFLQNSAN